MVQEKSRSFMLTMFGMLYFVQGIITAFTQNFAKPYLDSFGVSANLIGIMVTLLLLPFVLKVFYGMLSDRVNLFGLGHRLPYIVIALLLTAVAIFIAGFVDPATSFWAFAGMILLAAFAVALFDTTADGLAVDSTPVSEQGRVQSVMTSGRAVGIIVMSVLIGWIANRFGYFPVFVILALSMLLPLFWVLQVREPKGGTVQGEFDWGAFKALLKPSYLVFAGYGIVSWFSQQGVDGLATYFMSNVFNATEPQIGSFGSIRGIGMVGGAFLTSWIVMRFGRKTAAYLIAGLVTFGALLFSAASSITYLLGIAVVWGVISGLNWTIYSLLAMTRADPRIAGTMFAISMAVSNIGWALGDGISTSLTDNWGFANVYLFLAATNLLTFPVLWWLFKMSPTSENLSEEETAVLPAA